MINVAAEDAGLSCVVTNHVGSAISSVADMQSVLDASATPMLGALLEIGHFAAAGERWEDAAEALRGRIGLVHVKDIRDGAPVPYGTGEIDFAAVFRLLAQMQYAGPVVVEIEKVPEDRIEAEFARAVEHVAAMSAEAGLT